jgi:hypothetical protein
MAPGTVGHFQYHAGSFASIVSPCAEARRSCSSMTVKAAQNEMCIVPDDLTLFKYTGR